MTITPYSISESTKISEAYLNNVVNEAKIPLVTTAANKLGRLLGGKAAKVVAQNTDDVARATANTAKNSADDAAKAAASSADDVAKNVTKNVTNGAANMADDVARATVNNADDFSRPLTQHQKDILNPPKKGIPWKKIIAGAGATDVALSVDAERSQNKDATELRDRLRDIRIQANGDVKKLIELISQDSRLQKRFNSDELAKIASGASVDSVMGKHFTKKPSWLEQQFQGNGALLDAVEVARRVPFVNILVDGIDNIAAVRNGNKGFSQAVAGTLPVVRQISKYYGDNAQPTSQQSSYNEKLYSGVHGAADALANENPSSPLSKFVTPPSLPINKPAYDRADATTKLLVPLVKNAITPNTVDKSTTPNAVDSTVIDLHDVDL